MSELVNQVGLITGVYSFDEQDLHQNLDFFKVSQTGIETIKSKLSMKTFDEYTNILKDRETHRQRRLDPDSLGPTRTHVSLHHLPLSLAT